MRTNTKSYNPTFNLKTKLNIFVSIKCLLRRILLVIFLNQYQIKDYSMLYSIQSIVILHFSFKNKQKKI